MRFAHVDEAGTSAGEPHCVVAGVVSHPDKQWLSVNKALKELAEEFVPAEHRAGTIFHAKDIWHGNKKFDKKLWPRPKRMELLGRIADLPDQHSLPIVWGFAKKSILNWKGMAKTPSEIQSWNYSIAFVICAVRFEQVLREMCGADELGAIIAEDTSHMRRFAQMGYKMLKDPSIPWKNLDNASRYIPLERIIEQPLFSQKDESEILQIADLIAFAFARRLNGYDDVQWLIDRFASQVVAPPKAS